MKESERKIITRENKRSGKIEIRMKEDDGRYKLKKRIYKNKTNKFRNIYIYTRKDENKYQKKEKKKERKR